MPPGRPSREVVYQRLDTQVAELWTRLGGLPNRAEARGIWREIWLEEAHHSTAIEGNTLVLKQVQQLLDEGKAVGNKQLKEYMEVRGYAAAADWVYGEGIDGSWSDGDTLTLTEIREIHRLAMDPVWSVEPHSDADAEEGPGDFRRHDIHAFPGGMIPAPFTDIQALMTEWVDQANALRPREAAFSEHVARLHCAFEQIHPFIDGNGRTGRLVMNLLLVRMGYPPAIIFKNQRRTYLRAMRRADDGQPGELGELIARAISTSLYRFIIPAVAGPARLVPLVALANEQFTETALRLAAVRGRLEAIKGSDGQWRSTRNWVEEYEDSLYRRPRRAT